MRKLWVILWMLCFGMLSAQTYHVGDVYTAPDGSRGIVYYLHPDGSGGWVVALTDASTSCMWGDFSDVPGLANQDPSQLQNMLYDTAGYANTLALRNHQNNSTDYAAGKVDFAHGWVLPSPAQLSMLFAQLPFISSAITDAGGTEMTTDQYWCSAEKNDAEAWLIHYTQGTFHTSSKMNPHSVRAVRSFTYESTYVWSTGDTTATISVNPMQTTEYSVTVTSPSGCSGSMSHTVTVAQSESLVDTVYLCHDSATMLTARVADTYLWSTGATTQSIAVSSSGFYMVTVTLDEGCLAVDTFKVITVKVNGISNIDIPDVCAGDIAAITVGHSASCNLAIVNHETILALNDTVFLPDGADCPPYGCSYQSPLTFAGYADTAKVNSVNDIRYVRLNIEHSWAGDLYINLTCPNGQKADILKYGNGYSNAAACYDSIPLSSRGWQTGDNADEYTFFGVANDDFILQYSCDPTHYKNSPGYGWNYCWSNNNIEGYTYAAGDGLIYREDNVTLAYSPFMDDYWFVYDSSDVSAGTQFYHPDESFDSLVGCPLNGDWYIEVMDGNRVDNGYIFGWELALAEDILEVEYADVVSTTVDGPWVTTTSDSSFLFTPPANLPNDTTVSYTFHCHSLFGCGYDTVVQVTFYARQDIVIDTTACNSLVWDGVTYTSDTTLADSLTNIHGCDSIMTVNIHVITTPSVDIMGSQSFCPGDSVTLTAVADGQVQYLWSNGMTDSAITVAEEGVYTVTATFPGGCTAESAEFHLFEVENPILGGFLNDMVAGDTQTVVIGTMAGDNLQYQLPQSTLTYSTVTFLPDGEPCGDPPSCSYKATMSFSGFPETAVIHSADEIRYIRLNMEHSWIKDLYINLTCPNGKSADILKKFNGNSTSPCLDSISPSHRGWQNNYFESTYTSIYFGYAFWRSDNEDRCDPNRPDNQPGIGWNYCWSNNTTEGYQYAPGAGSLIYDPENVHTHTVDYLTKYVVDSSDAAAGTNFYHPDVPFDSLVGCPVNGLWTVEVIDGIQGDNGYIFECELSVAEHLSGTHYAHVSETGFEGLWAESGSTDSTFAITPPEDLANDTIVAYNFTLTDENGCLFDTTIYIHIYAHKHTDLYDTVTASELPYVWNGPTITNAGCSDTLLFTTHGADSVVTMHLSVIYSFDTTICTNTFPLSWHGHTFNAADTFMIPYPLACGCDSMEVLAVMESPVYQDTSYISVCESNLPYLWHNQALNATGFYADTLFTVAGCDSILVLNLHVDEVYEIPLEESICQGDTFQFFDRMLTQSGVYTDTLQTSSGCDSVIVLNLTVNPTYNIPFTITICQGEEFFFLGQVLTEEGVYADTMQTVAGCDSVITLTLVVNPTYNIPVTDSICQGDTFLFFGQQLTEAGEYTEPLQTTKGCDSVITLTLTVNPTYSIPVSEAICAGDTFDFHGESLTDAGVYTDTLQTVSGCDSIIVLNLSVNPVYNTPLSDTICAGDTLHFFSQLLTSEGIYTDTLQTVSGCDSVITLNLTVNPVYNVPMSEEICAGDTFLFFGQSFMTAGLYTDTLQTVNGCDSVISLNLTVNEATSETIVVNIVENDLPYEINQTSYDTAGTYIQHLTNVAGCDSLLTIHLYVANNTITHRQAMICQNMLPALWQGHVWHGAGVVIDTLEAATGADSIVVLTLTVGLPTESEIYDTILQNNLPFVLNDSSYFAAGVYVQHRINVAGCDSTITIHLTVLNNVRTELDTTVCDSLLPVAWNGLTFAEAGTDSVMLVAANGVDSTVVMTVNVHLSSDSTLVVSAIENSLPFVLNGFEYGGPGTYTQNLDNAIGCDSTLTLVLTVLYNVRAEVDSAVCDSLLPITWNEVEFSGAGTDSVTILAASGVDSTVVMTVTITYPTEGTFADTVVENSLPYLLNGYSYDSAGIYTQHLTNVGGCDSTLTFELTVLYNVASEADSAVCPNALPIVWNGKTFTAAGVQSAVLTAANGVDSTVTMTVTTLPSPTAHISGPSVLCADSYTTLVADSAVSYLWSNGMTTQSINLYASGSYSVTVTNDIGCTASDTYTVGNVVTVDPIASINLPDMCAGNSYTITVGYHSTDNFVIGTIEETHSVAETVFLPDGIYCSPYGCSYQSPLTFTDFAAGATVTHVNDIRYVRLNMEHSYAGDIYINITCPNGQKADIMKYAGTGTSNCTGSIPPGSIGWQSGNNASQSTFFGMAYDYSTTSCNSSVSANAPGVGWNYCWSNNTDQGYSYAPGTGSLIYRSANSHYHPYAYGTNSVSIFDSSNVAAGTQFYHPDQSFSSLIGCPLNGSWYIEVVDGYSVDNGYLFGWELALASTFATTNNTEVVAVTVEGPWVTMTDTTTFVIAPPDTLQHDTLVAYTVYFYDENGCGYDTVVFLDVYAQSHVAFDTTVCGSFVWGGTTYTQSQMVTWNGTNVHGCDSTVAINLNVYPNPVVTITGLPVACVDDTAHLVAACVDTAAILVWSTGDTAQAITVATAGTYTVTATNAGGCSSESTVAIAFSSPSQSTTDTTVCDSFLWNGTLYTQTGTYRDTLTNAAGCDSVATLNLTVNYSYLAHDTLQLLQGQLPYYFAPADTTFSYGSPAEFQFSYTLPAQNGCDSVILEKVYVYMNFSQSFDTTVCASAVPLTWHGHTFTTTATVTDSLLTVHGSDSVLTYTVTVDIISANIGNVTHIACYGDNTGAATATVTGGIPPLAYQWTNGAGASVSTSTQISNRPVGDYTFTVTDAAGCSATASVTLNTLHGQMLPGTISGPQTLCFGDTLGTVTGTAASGDGCVYQWQSSTDGMAWTPLQGTNNTQNYMFQSPVTSSFYLRRAWISTDCGTLYSDTLDISVWPVSSDTIYDDICMGNPYNEHGFNISETETVGLGTLTSWIHYTSVHGCDSTVTLILDIHEPQKTDISAEICEGTGYYANGFAVPASETIGEDSLSRVLNLQTVDGCDSIVQLEITVIDTALRIVSPTADFCEDMVAELFVVTNMTNYEWSTGEQTPNITVTAPGVYNVTASEGGCSVTARYVIEPCVYQLYLPNAITPARGDGLNDYFYIPELAKGSINLFEISIFNRWGELVFYSTDKNFQWNGEYKGKIYHQTVYTYIIEYTDYAGRPFRVTGSITVL